MMYLKVHEVNRKGIYEKIVAVCDSGILGKKFKHDGAEVFVNPRFYKGEKADEKKVLKSLDNATITNFFGEEAVSVGIKSGLINEKNVIMIKKTPHAQGTKLL